MSLRAKGRTDGRDLPEEGHPTAGGDAGDVRATVAGHSRRHRGRRRSSGTQVRREVRQVRWQPGSHPRRDRALRRRRSARGSRTTSATPTTMSAASPKHRRSTITDMQVEVRPGLVAGQKAIPCEAAGCYAPGGRYSHVASAMMTVTTAKVAGCRHIAACSPPRPGTGINPAIIYTADLCGADSILAMGGVQGIAAMAFGLFGLPKADILVGPGNQFVAEAKRILFGRVGIDMFAGPTDSLIIADRTADPEIVAWDLVGQAEHGYNSPVWLVTDDRALARSGHCAGARTDRDAARTERAECDGGLARLCRGDPLRRPRGDGGSLRRYRSRASSGAGRRPRLVAGRLTCYGSLFLGEETTVAFGDKASGTNHVLPTSGAARYTGGLSVAQIHEARHLAARDRDGSRPLAEATARISRLGGHGRPCPHSRHPSRQVLPGREVRTFGAGDRSMTGSAHVKGPLRWDCTSPSYRCSCPLPGSECRIRR